MDFVGVWLMLPIAPHELRLCPDMAVHGFQQVILHDTRFQIQLCIQGIEFKEITMGPAGWAGPA